MRSSGISMLQASCGVASQWGTQMGLLIVYIVLVVIGDIGVYLIGLAVEQNWPAASMPVFLGLYFLLLWAAWILAVWLTRPKSAAPA
jgi:hypothetical protein